MCDRFPFSSPLLPGGNMRQKGMLPVDQQNTEIGRHLLLLFKMNLVSHFWKSLKKRWKMILGQFFLSRKQKLPPNVESRLVFCFFRQICWKFQGNFATDSRGAEKRTIIVLGQRLKAHFLPFLANFSKFSVHTALILALGAERRTKNATRRHLKLICPHFLENLNFSPKINEKRARGGAGKIKNSGRKKNFPKVI